MRFLYYSFIAMAMLIVFVLAFIQWDDSLGNRYVLHRDEIIVYNDEQYSVDYYAIMNGDMLFGELSFPSSINESESVKFSGEISYNFITEVYQYKINSVHIDNVKSISDRLKKTNSPLISSLMSVYLSGTPSKSIEFKKVRNDFGDGVICLEKLTPNILRCINMFGVSP